MTSVAVVTSSAIAALASPRAARVLAGMAMTRPPVPRAGDCGAAPPSCSAGPAGTVANPWLRTQKAEPIVPPAPPKLKTYNQTIFAKRAARLQKEKALANQLPDFDGEF